MRSGWVAVAAVAACYHATDYSHCSDCQRDAPVTGSDASNDATDAQIADAGPLCFGHSPMIGGMLEVCPAGMPAPIDVGSAMGVHTGSASTFCSLTQQVNGAGPMVCVAVGTTVMINGTLKADGPNPLVIAATDDITVTFPITVSSQRGSIMFGAGGGHDCGAGSGAASAVAGAGGAGGSYGATGGSGGTTGGVITVASPNPVATPLGVNGGCNGGIGGDNGTGLNTTIPAYGGGAIVLISKTRIRIAAGIDASGAGGQGGGVAFGGNGGASGGMIVLDAPEIDFLGGHLAAVGGGGGQGGGAVPGANGGDPSGITPGSGGTSSSTCANDGGDGGGRTAAGVGASTTSASCGGGGGGGGAGFIFVQGTPVGTPNSAPAITPL